MFATVRAAVAMARAYPGRILIASHCGRAQHVNLHGVRGHMISVDPVLAEVMIAAVAK